MIVRNEAKERVVLCELLIPDTPNSFGDIYTEDAIKEFCYAYAATNFEIDVNHDKVDIKGKDAIIVESFIAREKDPTFVKGSWVIGMKILSDELWERILSGEINGFSYEALVLQTDVEIQHLRNRLVVGVTEPDVNDGHTHTFAVVVNPLNRPISGGTGVSDAHSHRISVHTVTDKSISVFGAGEHVHRFQVIQHTQGENDAD